MPTLQNNIDKLDEKASIKKPTRMNPFGSRYSSAIINACGQKKNATCGNATRW
jgi:hypothetical protein